MFVISLNLSHSLLVISHFLFLGMFYQVITGCYVLLNSLPVTWVTDVPANFQFIVKWLHPSDISMKCQKGEARLHLVLIDIAGYTWRICATFICLLQSKWHNQHNLIPNDTPKLRQISPRSWPMIFDRPQESRMCPKWNHQFLDLFSPFHAIEKYSLEF